MTQEQLKEIEMTLKTKCNEFYEAGKKEGAAEERKRIRRIIKEHKTENGQWVLQDLLKEI